MIQLLTLILLAEHFDKYDCSSCKVEVASKTQRFGLADSEYDEYGFRGKVSGNLTHREQLCKGTLTAQVKGKDAVITTLTRDVTTLTVIQPGSPNWVEFVFGEEFDFHGGRIQSANIRLGSCASSEPDPTKKAAEICRGLKARIANRRLVDLTVDESERMAACKAAGLW